MRLTAIRGPRVAFSQWCSHISSAALLPFSAAWASVSIARASAFCLTTREHSMSASSLSLSTVGYFLNFLGFALLSETLSM
jgi:hypothetical protein